MATPYPAIAGQLPDSSAHPISLKPPSSRQPLTCTRDSDFRFPSATSRGQPLSPQCSPMSGMTQRNASQSPLAPRAEARIRRRFSRHSVLAAREVDDLLIAFRRVISILRGAVNVKDLARLLLAWTDPVDNRAKIARTRFAFDFHRAARFAPESAPENEV